MPTAKTSGRAATPSKPKSRHGVEQQWLGQLGEVYL